MVSSLVFAEDAVPTFAENRCTRARLALALELVAAFAETGRSRRINTALLLDAVPSLAVTDLALRKFVALLDDDVAALPL